MAVKIRLLKSNSVTDEHFFSSSAKKQTDDLFDSLDTSKLNAHLKELMPGLTAKVFRTYNASITLDEKVSFKLRSITTSKLYNQFPVGHLKYVNLHAVGVIFGV